MTVLLVRRVLFPIKLILSTGTFLFACTAFANAQTQRVSILGIEVTQGIQSMSDASPHDLSKDNLVPLIKNRKTLIRVYFSERGRYRARLIVSNSSGEQGTPLKSLNNGNAAVGLANRNDLRSSLNFEVPSTLLRGDNLIIQAISLVNAAGNPHPRFTCDNCSSYLAAMHPLPLGESFPLRLRLIGLSYDAEDKPHSPSELEFRRILSWLRRTYPVSEILQFPSHTTGAPISDIVPYDTSQGDLFEEIDGEPQGCFRTNEQLRLIKERDLEANQNDEVEFRKVSQTRYVGILADRGRYIRGCANGSPDTNANIMVTAPVGNAQTGRFEWDKDGFYGDWQVAHELGHTFGHKHLTGPDGSEACGAIEPTDPRDARISPASSNHVRYVGLDFGDKIESPDSSNTKLFPLKAIRGDWYDFMSYCPVEKWINPDSYITTLSALTLENISINVMALVAPPPLAGGNNTIQANPQPVPDDLPKPNTHTPVPLKVEKGRFIRALAKIDLSTGQGSLTHVREAPLVLALPSPQDQTDIQLRITFEQGTSITQPMRRQTYPDARSQKNRVGTAEVNVPIPDTEKPSKIELLINDTVVDTIVISTPPPSIQIKPPSQSELDALKAGKPLQLRWNLPNDDNNLTYTIQISYDKGRSWHTTAINLKDPQFQLSPDQAVADDNIKVRVTASNRYSNLPPVPNVPGVPSIPETFLTIPGISLKQYGPKVFLNPTQGAHNVRTKIKANDRAKFMGKPVAVSGVATKKQEPNTR